ncbi:DUF6283 family protein [Nocardia suismassiliense]|uniref:DUF6283 family protein n=1 Tax=Nocardia suismassiliense TaxID=2077092 RepID=A0ABW6QSB1_9NOCA
MDTDRTTGQQPLRRRLNTPCTNLETRVYECPWVVSTPAGQFSRERFEALADTTGAPGQEAGLDRVDDLDSTPLFACHQSIGGREQACAGWLAAVGWTNLKLRFEVARGRLDAEALEPGPGWPQLHTSYAEMMDAKIIDDPAPPTV